MAEGWAIRAYEPTDLDALHLAATQKLPDLSFRLARLGPQLPRQLGALFRHGSTVARTHLTLPRFAWPPPSPPAGAGGEVYIAQV